MTVASAAGNQGFGVTAAGIVAYLTGRAAVGASAGDLLPGMILLAVCVVGKGASAWLEMWVAHDLAYRIMIDVRGDIFDGLERLAPGWLMGKRTGDVAAAAVADVENLEWFYAHAVAQFAVTVLTPLAAVGVLATIDLRVALALLPFALLILTVPFWLARLGDRQGVELRTRLGHLHADAVDGVHGLRELLLFGQAQRFRHRLIEDGRRLNRAHRANGSRMGVENGVTDALVAGAMLSVLATGATLVASGQMSAANYPVVVILAAFSLVPITEITGGIRNLGVLRATASRVFAVTDTPAQVSDRSEAATDAEDLSAQVRFEDVHFRYSPVLPDVLHGVSFAVDPGQTVALVGSSGAGKSTCANLLLRFWDPTGGRITLGGSDLRDLTQAALRERVALVPQDVYLFNNSIAENIRLGRPEASDTDVADVARRALVSQFADDLRDGLDTVVGERGAALSGGQRQRIALARALLRDASRTGARRGGVQHRRRGGDPPPRGAGNRPGRPDHRGDRTPAVHDPERRPRRRTRRRASRATGQPRRARRNARPVPASARRPGRRDLALSIRTFAVRTSTHEPMQPEPRCYVGATSLRKRQARTVTSGCCRSLTPLGSFGNEVAITSLLQLTCIKQRRWAVIEGCVMDRSLSVPIR